MAFNLGSSRLRRDEACHSQGQLPHRDRCRRHILCSNWRSDTQSWGETVTGTSVNHKTIAMEFNVGNISRHMASIGEINGTDNRAIFDSGNAFVENKANGAWIPPRRKEHLVYLDVVSNSE